MYFPDFPLDLDLVLVQAARLTNLVVFVFVVLIVLVFIVLIVVPQRVILLLAHLALTGALVLGCRGSI